MPPKQSQSGIARWVRPLYLYLVSIICMIVFIIGSVSIINLLIREYVFGVHGSWYQDPESSCEYILTATESKQPVVARMPVPQHIETQDLTEMTQAERLDMYERCVERQEEKMAIEHRYRFADTMSTGIAMILIAIPLFLVHWRLIKREHSKL